MNGRLKGYKLCKLCGCPLLKRGQVRKNPHEYRHARGCPADDYKPDAHVGGEKGGR